ncbi:MAG: hypothetical protein MJ110_03695 [Lachnospiraceae bacterium]|nr:hypothetical protein [Lachnospiraceae bacterium]
MGELILCKENTAANPFYLDEGSLNVYSIEELSYYIENNVLFLNVDFMSLELINWIDHQLHMTDLAEGLRQLLGEGASLDQFLGLILQEGGFCSTLEMKNVLLAAQSVANKTKEEMQKMRGDRMLAKGNPLGAIYLYRKIFAEGNRKNISDGDLASVWHNLGTAHARLFQFEDATISFEEAFNIGHRFESKRQMVFAVICSEDEKMIEHICEKYGVSEDELKHFEWEITESKKDAGTVLAFDKETRQMVIDEWKHQYRLQSSV